jgi:hypothetical protein
MANTSGSASKLPSLPGLEIKGIGTVPLPVTETFAQQLTGTVNSKGHGTGKQGMRLCIEADEL